MGVALALGTPSQFRGYPLRSGDSIVEEKV